MDEQTSPSENSAPLRRSRRLRQTTQQSGISNGPSSQNLRHGSRTAHDNAVSQTAAGNSDEPASRSSDKTLGGETEMITEDDVCPICRLLLYRPVTTSCNHTLCESCMATWADVSVTSQMEIVDVDEAPVAFNSVSGLEARCPMCRTQTSATLNEARLHEIKQKYPQTHAEREAEETASRQDGNGDEIQTLALSIGNRHRLVGDIDEGGNIHEWTFFVRPSRTDIIEEVQIQLHHTFRPSRIIRTRQPYEIRRLGWGSFVVIADVILKAGYSWVSSNAEDSPDGAEKGMLGLGWKLDFDRYDGKGCMARLKLKVKHQRGWEDISDEEEEEERVWERLVRQYNSDGGYVPEEEI